MSIKMQLESIFPELYKAERAGDSVTIAAPAPVAEEPEGGEEAGEPEPPPPDTYEHATGVPYEVAMAGIQLRLQQSLHGTKEAAQHMADARRLAATQDKAEQLQYDFAYGYDHRKTGMPGLPSHLKLDGTTMATRGLLQPREILKSVRGPPSSANPGRRPNPTRVGARPLAPAPPGRRAALRRFRRHSAFTLTRAPPPPKPRPPPTHLPRCRRRRRSARRSRRPQSQPTRSRRATLRRRTTRRRRRRTSGR